MIELMPLAHGALGNLDELVLALVIGIPAVLVGAAMFIARSREDKPADPAPTASQPESDQAAPDHFNLD